jgi:ATP-dependent Clp protease protease subunit
MNRKLFDLARANAGEGAPLRAETKDDVATIYVYDVIDSYFGVTAAEFARILAAITAPNIDLRVNCPGGDVFEARAMMAQLVAHPAKVTAKIDGLAASAATALVLAADTVEIAEGGFFMIHNAWTWMIGNAAELRQSADLLDKVDGVLADGYAKRTGKDRGEIDAWMAAETWFEAEEAVANGFCDSVLQTVAGGSGAKAQAYNLAVYDKAPKALIQPRAEPDDTVRQRMLARLGLYERTAG